MVVKHISIFRKLLFTFLSTCLIFTAIEIGSRMLWGTPQAYLIAPIPSKNRQFFTIEKDQVLPTYQGEFSIAPFPQKASKKPRVIFLGGSSIRGGNGISNFRDEMPAILEERLGIEALNLAAPGLDSSHLLAMMPEVLALQPAAIVLYTGHNDRGNAVFYNRYGSKSRAFFAEMRGWLGGLKTFQLLEANMSRREYFPLPNAETEGLYNVSPEQAEEVRVQFESRLRRILRMAKKEGVPMVVSSVISNPLAPLNTWSCPKALQNLGLSTRFFDIPSVDHINQARIDAQFKLFPDCPDIFWVQGLLYAKEQKAYTMSSKLDEIRDFAKQPVRADRATNQIIQKITKEEKGWFVDVNQLVRTVGKGIEPSGIFEDAVHFKPVGQKVLAFSVAPVLAKAINIPAPHLPTVHQIIVQSGETTPR